MGDLDSQFFGQSGINRIPSLKIQTCGTHLQRFIEMLRATRRHPILVVDWDVGYTPWFLILVVDFQHLLDQMAWVSCGVRPICNAWIDRKSTRLSSSHHN